jgi:hypothetical protein
MTLSLLITSTRILIEKNLTFLLLSFLLIKQRNSLGCSMVELSRHNCSPRLGDKFEKPFLCRRGVFKHKHHLVLFNFCLELRPYLTATTPGKCTYRKEKPLNLVSGQTTSWTLGHEIDFRSDYAPFRSRWRE